MTVRTRFQAPRERTSHVSVAMKRASFNAGLAPPVFRLIDNDGKSVSLRPTYNTGPAQSLYVIRGHLQYFP
jgi:hypothetical protein